MEKVLEVFIPDNATLKVMDERLQGALYAIATYQSDVKLTLGTKVVMLVSVDRYNDLIEKLETLAGRFEMLISKLEPHVS